MKYIRFRNPNEPKQSEISDLMERIRAEISPGKNIIATSAAPSHYETTRESAPLKSAVRETSPTTADLPPISEWTPSDIRRWFDQHGIMSELHDLFRFRSGTEMLDYAQTLVNNRDVQERTYSEIFTQKYQGQLLPPHEFNRFAKALQQLMKENSVVHSIVPQAKRSSTCAVF